METPICVTDAITFIDHIHEIKSWIYEGRLRLIVPLTTFEHVVQLSEKSKESKPTTSQAPPPKTFGRQARKEYPAFDINHHVAREYLARIKAGKTGIGGAKERPSCGQEERHGAVDFQQPKEEYAPWKDAPVEEEKTEVQEDRPISWAEAARRKQNLANGISEKNHAPKVPAKPKLVSKMFGSDTSPWKMQKNAPTICAREVPAALRPFMSCALWRLHESIDRNDANQLFLLSDQQSIRNVAQKLSITVRSSNELGERIASTMEKPDLDAFGELERCFGMNNKAEQLTTDPTNLLEGLSTPSLHIDEASSRSENFKNPPTSAGGHQIDGDSHEAFNERDEQVGSGDEKTLREEDGLVQSTATLVEEEVSVEKSVEKHPYVERLEVENDCQDFGKQSIDPTTADCLRVGNQQTLHSSPQNMVQDVKGHPPKEKVADVGQSILPIEPRSIQEPEPQVVTHSRDVGIDRPAPSKIEDEPADSDEEVVVFVPNAKRMSAQKKPNRQSSRPSSAVNQPQPKSDNNTSRPSTANSQSYTKPTIHAHKISSSGSHAHSNVVSLPPVIDPDAFGRGFAFNPNPNARTNVRNHRSRHSPRPSAQKEYPNSLINGGTSRQNPPTSPTRHTPSSSPQAISHNSGQKIEDVQNKQSTGGQVVSPPAHLRAPVPGLVGVGNEESHPLTTKGHQIPSQANVQDPDFIRTPNPRQVPRANPQRVAGPDFDRISNNMLRYSPHPNAPNGAIAPASRMSGEKYSKPMLFEHTLDQTRAPVSSDLGPKATMPEVDYVLKRGSTREATRGKGKLWVA